jgi:hypothetical protein
MLESGFTDFTLAYEFGGKEMPSPSLSAVFVEKQKFCVDSEHMLCARVVFERCFFEVMWVVEYGNCCTRELCLNSASHVA